MDVRQIVDLVKQSPQVQQAVDVIEQQLARAPIMPEDIDEIIAMLEAVVEDPNRYPEVRAAAVKDGFISDRDAPQEYDPAFVIAVLVALYEYRDRLSTQGYARGGLKVAARQLASAGRGGDSVLAHINPREAEMLRRMGGSGTVNPNTGLREYKSGKQILGAVLPIALNFIVPGIGGMIGSAVTGAAATSLTATMVGGALLGGVSSAIAGGDPLKGALLGGLGGGLGESVGSTLAPGMGATGQSILGGAVVGGAAGALTGQGFGKGALMGAAGAGLGAVSQGVGSGAVGAGIGSAGQMAGNMITAGYKPKEALIGGALSGLVAGMNYKPPGSGLKPSDAVTKDLRGSPLTSELPNYEGKFAGQGLKASPAPAGELSLAGTTPAAPGMEGALGSGLTPPANSPFAQSSTAPAGSSGAGMPGLKNMVTLAMLSGLSGAPPQAVEAVKQLRPEQQEYFNRPNVSWDWDRMQRDASAANMSLSQYMAGNWPSITGYAQGADARQGAYVGMAMGGMYAAGGGALGAVARLVRGGGSGRDDTINARLSDGEYVMDAETVAMLGDGSTDAGARRLDAMREQLRRHKGRTLAKGKFSPNAKSPLAYLKGAA